MSKKRKGPKIRDWRENPVLARRLGAVDGIREAARLIRKWARNSFDARQEMSLNFAANELGKNARDRLKAIAAETGELQLAVEEIDAEVRRTLFNAGVAASQLEKVAMRVARRLKKEGATRRNLRNILKDEARKAGSDSVKQ